MILLQNLVFNLLHPSTVFQTSLMAAPSETVWSLGAGGVRLGSLSECAREQGHPLPLTALAYQFAAPEVRLFICLLISGFLLLGLMACFNHDSQQREYWQCMLN
jgi:hypothetical protein